MSPYITIILWTSICALVSNTSVGRSVLQRPENVYGDYVDIRYTFFWALIIFLPIIIMATFRVHFGDTEVYRYGFLNVPSTIGEFLPYYDTVQKDKGYTVFSFLVKLVIGNRDKLFFLLVAFIQGISLVYTYRKYSVDYAMSILLFLLSTDYLSWMFNGMRQFIAASVLFACMGLILKKKYIPAVLMVLLLSTIHGSAILMLPMIFVAQGKAWNKKVILFTVAIVFAIFFLGQFTNILDTMLADTQYSTIMSDEIWTQDDGTSFLRVLVYSVPAIIAFFGRKRIWSIDDPVVNLSTNMSIISAGIYLISMFTSGIYVGRLPIYFSLYSYILLPWEAKHLFVRDSSKIVYLAMIGGYLAFYYFQMHLIWGAF